MEPYILYGTVLPERAQLSLEFRLGFSHLASGVQGQAKVSILLNQVVVWVESDHAWDAYDLRNVVRNIVQNQLAMVGYIKGFAYDLEITRMLHQSRNIDVVYGIDIQCLAKRNESLDLQEALVRLRKKIIGINGILIGRCFNDLVSAMRHPDDTGFYCYRAIESLRHHCAASHSLSDAAKARQWEKLREISGCDEQAFRTLKDAADPLRHGEGTGVSGEERENLLTTTWYIVDAYLDAL